MTLTTFSLKSVPFDRGIDVFPYDRDYTRIDKASERAPMQPQMREWFFAPRRLFGAAVATLVLTFNLFFALTVPMIWERRRKLLSDRFLSWGTIPKLLSFCARPKLGSPRSP